MTTDGQNDGRFLRADSRAKELGVINQGKTGSHETRSAARVTCTRLRSFDEKRASNRIEETQMAH